MSWSLNLSWVEYAPVIKQCELGFCREQTIDFPIARYIYLYKHIEFIQLKNLYRSQVTIIAVVYKIYNGF